MILKDFAEVIAIIVGIFSAALAGISAARQGYKDEISELRNQKLAKENELVACRELLRATQEENRDYLRKLVIYDEEHYESARQKKRKDDWENGDPISHK